MAKRPVALAAALLAATVLAGGCDRPSHRSADHRPPTRVSAPRSGAPVSQTPTYRVNQDWDAPPGWRLRVTGMECGIAADPGSGDPDAGDVCLVAVAFTNVGDQARPFSGTPDAAGPTWRIVGYDGRGREFHGHGRLEGLTRPGGSGTSQLVFEVPTGLRLNRVLLGDAMVTL